MNRNEFNEKQLLAIDTPITKNVLVSAAAGSGKTKTLSTKVFNIINNKEIKPSELLVLTFTKNAAYEMKTRIIKTFKDNKKFDLATEMKSAHIQTFDSFSLELVQKNAGLLGIADTISIIDDSLIKSKRSLLLNEILDEYYNNDCERITKTLKKFNSKNDSKTKEVILDLDIRLDKMPIEKRNEFINNYEELFLSTKSFNGFFDKYIDLYKKELKKVIIRSFVLEKSIGLFKVTGNAQDGYHYSYDKIAEIKNYLSNIDNFNYDYDKLVFDHEDVDNLYNEYKRILKLDSYEFLKYANDVIHNSSNELYYKTISGKREQDKINSLVYNTLRKPFAKIGNSNPTFIGLPNVEDINDLYLEYYSFKEDISLIFEIINKLDKQIEDYKRISSNYTYNDVSKFTDMLLTNEKFKSVQDNLRKQFKYIMVDEYQDSNDYQESLINSLLKYSNNNGTHLFCVGDVKQSIYAFRNSKVELFRNRQKEYSNGNNDNLVIDMNYNYRSGKGLLDDINYLFESYMRIDNGSIDYKLDSEKLHYDMSKNLYHEKYDNFGVERILPKFKGDNIFEARAIISDIKEKIASHYKVYDKKEGIRDCKYSDFAIITRTKKGFLLYQKLFYENNIPLNLKVNDVLTEVDAIIVMQSIFNLVNALIKKEENVDIKHLFASLARSYIYEVSDDELHNILMDKTNKSLYNHKIIKDVYGFINDNKNNEFDVIFLNAINYFNIIANLNKIGNVVDNINKIDSLYNLVLNEKHNGEGLDDFVDLFKNLSKNKIDLSFETNIENNNAVDMMTIHASKGLERKIVYMPSYYNKNSKLNIKPDYIFSKELGLIFNNYLNEENYETILKRFYDELLFEKKEEDDEFVRLMYVAFTRAENTLIIVGNNDKGVNQVYGGLPFIYELDNDFINKYINKIGLESVLTEYDRSIDMLYESYDLKKIDISELSDINLQAYYDITDIFYSTINQYHKICVKKIDEAVRNYFIDVLESKDNKEDILARIYGFSKGFMNIKSLDDLYDKITVLNEIKQESEDDEDSDSELESISDISELQEKIYDFYDGIVGSDKFADTRYLIYALDDVKFYFEKNYTFYNFIDKRRYINTDKIIIKAVEPTIDMSKYIVDDKEIVFDKIKTFRASIKLSTDEEKEIREKLDYGTYLHHLLELVDLKTKDTSFIKDIHDKELIDGVLKLDIFNLNNAVIYKEYEYYDNLFDTVGSIDLLYIKDGIYYIIDYKSSDIDKEGYINQLHTYQRNVMDKFNIKSESIRLYLVSITKQSFIEVNAYKE